MSDILQLPGLDVIEIHEDRHDYLIRVAQTCRIAGCPACGGPLVGNGTKPQGIRDAPVHDKRLPLEWARRRHPCRPCGETTDDRHGAFDTGHRMTGRPVEHIGRAALRRTFASIAEAVGVDERTVRLLRAERSGREIGRLEFATPRWLGMDQVHLVGKARAVSANVEARTALDIEARRPSPLGFHVSRTRRPSRWSPWTCGAPASTRCGPRCRKPPS